MQQRKQPIGVRSVGERERRGPRYRGDRVPSSGDPGIPLEEVSEPGALVPKDSYLEFAKRGPGFDLGVAEEWLVPFKS